MGGNRRRRETPADALLPDDFTGRGFHKSRQSIVGDREKVRFHIQHGRHFGHALFLLPDKLSFLQVALAAKMESLDAFLATQPRR